MKTKILRGIPLISVSWGGFLGCDPSPIAPLEGELGSFAGMVNDIVGTGKLGDFLDMVLLVVIGGFGSQLVLGEWGLRFDVIRDFGST